jgi:hypothetical protein
MVMYAHKHTNMHIHICAHTHARTHTRAHAHTHKQIWHNLGLKLLGMSDLGNVINMSRPQVWIQSESVRSCTSVLKQLFVRTYACMLRGPTGPLTCYMWQDTSRETPLGKKHSKFLILLAQVCFRGKRMQGCYSRALQKTVTSSPLQLHRALISLLALSTYGSMRVREREGEYGSKLGFNLISPWGCLWE